MGKHVKILIAIVFIYFRAYSQDTTGVEFLVIYDTVKSSLVINDTTKSSKRKTVSGYTVFRNIARSRHGWHIFEYLDKKKRPFNKKYQIERL